MNEWTRSLRKIIYDATLVGSGMSLMLEGLPENLSSDGNQENVD